jgi:hypothetical protein
LILHYFGYILPASGYAEVFHVDASQPPATDCNLSPQESFGGIHTTVLLFFSCIFRKTLRPRRGRSLGRVLMTTTRGHTNGTAVALPVNTHYDEPALAS